MGKLFVAGLVLGLAIWGWRTWARRQRLGYIDGYPYARYLDQRLAKRRPELSAAQRAQVFVALVDYFQICRQAARRMVAMPSQAVDDAWHEFILFTRHYEHFCQRAFGRFLHHTPAEAMASPTQASDGLKRAWRLACARENINPRQPTRLPRLFALDAALGIAGGFVYHLDCMAARAAGQASGYCASDIGCSGGGSGCGGSSGCSGDSGGHGDGGGDGGGGCGGGCGGGGD